MLRESSNVTEKQIDLHDVTGGLNHETDIEHADLLMIFAENVVRRDVIATAELRDQMLATLGEAAVVDAAAVVSAFHGFVRLADSIGIPYEGAAGGQDSTELRDEIGISQFYRATAAE